MNLKFLQISLFFTLCLVNISCGERFLNLASKTDKASQDYREELARLGEAEEDYKKAKEDWLQAQKYDSDDDEYKQAKEDWKKAQEDYLSAWDDYESTQDKL